MTSVSLCVATLNEGPDLELTIESALGAGRQPDEIVVVSDSSRELEGKRLSLMDHPRVYCYANRGRIGAGASKHRAASIAEGDLVVIVDSHMRFPCGWLDTMLAHHERYPNDLISASSVDIKHTGFHGKGCVITPDEQGFYRARWSDPEQYELDEDADCPARPGFMGACYLLSKATLDAIGGWAPNQHGWGFEEEFVAMRMAMKGRRVRTALDVAVAHRYKREINRTPKRQANSTDTTWEPIWNKVVAGLQVFGPERFNEIYAPTITRLFPQHADKLDEEINIRKECLSQTTALLHDGALPEHLWMQEIGIAHHEAIDAVGKDRCGYVPVPDTSRPAHPAPRKLCCKQRRDFLCRAVRGRHAERGGAV